MQLCAGTSYLRPPAAACHSSSRSWPRPQTAFSGQKTLYISQVLNFSQLACPVVSKGVHPTPTWDDMQMKGEDDAEVLCQRIKEIKENLATLGDGDISISAYDTAWVALIQNIHGYGGPQFPSCLQWIIDNQLDDGSWGDGNIFIVCDRLINTLACIIALKSWRTNPKQIAQGTKFLQENLHKLGGESEEHFLIGFEVTFPPLIERARSLGIDIPYDSPILQKIHDMRELKLKRIPLDLLHDVPTMLLYSLEGLNMLDWKKLLPLKCSNGSFIFSPASTAYAVMNTSDESCLKYLEKIVSRFGGGVPCVYPVDMFERAWLVDRLQRLGISQYFQEEIKECVEYVFKHWTSDGMCWARNSSVHDIDDTSMGFRMLRLHGYDVSPDVFKKFRKSGEFVSYAGENSPAVTGTFNSYRAAQLAFPGEAILEEMKRFSYMYLTEKRAKNQLLDKWIITKDLAGEISYALDFPWIMNLPRVESRMFLEQYGGFDDVWIGKTLYRMLNVNNNTYLDLAKIDFHRCQALLQKEWIILRKWFIQHELTRYGVSIKNLLETYFLASSIIFEPKRENERMNWARTSILAKAIHLYAKTNGDNKLIENLVGELQILRSIYPSKLDKSHGTLIEVLQEIVDDISIKSIMRMEEKQGIGSYNQNQIDEKHQHLKHNLLQVWHDWMVKKLDEGLLDSICWEDGLLFVRTLEISAGRFGLEEALTYYSMSETSNVEHVKNQDGGSHNVNVQEYIELLNLMKSICHKLHHQKNHLGQKDEVIVKMNDHSSSDYDIQELTKHVLDNSSLVEDNTRKTFLAVIRSFYYLSLCPPSTMNLHIGKIIFERIA